MKNFIEQPNVSAEGHVLITDLDTKEVLLNKYNAINFENLAFAIANLLSGEVGHGINHMAFGYGGTDINQNGQVNYKTPKVNGADGGLYTSSNFIKQIQEFEVDDQETQPYTDLIMTVVLDYNEPSDAKDTDTSINFDLEKDYVFDEIGLVNNNNKFLTHLIFHPIQKSKNRKLEIKYSLRIKAGV